MRLRLTPLAVAASSVLMFSSVLQALNLSSSSSASDRGQGAATTTTNDNASVVVSPLTSSSGPLAGPGKASVGTAAEDGTCQVNKGGARTAHLVVLVHGWMGNPLELGYLQEAMTNRAHEREQLSSDGSVALVVRSSQVNDGRTFDGIKAGGERLATEVSGWIDELLSDAAPGTIEKVSLSFVGNSLGGLYARYAIGVPELLDLDRVEPKLFCTTATPHLGVAGHTYVALPRFMEGWVATFIGSTGHDLFRRNDTLERMTTDTPFVNGLRKFRKRIAYANAHYTDFQVPSATAAFVTPNLDSPHVRITAPQPDFVAIAVETPMTEDLSPKPSEPRNDPMSANEMARRLDELGWTKVFVDLRPRLVSMPIPFKRPPSYDDPNDRDRYTSSELHDRYCRITDRIHFPLGHTVLVANSKSSFYRRLNAAGKPVVDRVAADLLRDILE